MDFIDNPDLREWVKKSLRKTLFQKAHELAVQTGCEVLLRVQDVSAKHSQATQYYATPTVQTAYESNKFHKRPSEVLVSGETGLPAARKVDRGIQMTDVNDTASVPSSEGDDELMHDPFLHDNGMNTGNHGEDRETNDEMNHADTDPAQKIDLTQDSDSDDSIVEVGEVKEEPRMTQNQGGFKQEQRSYQCPPNVFTHPNPYQCGVCQKAFDNLQVLENHNRMVHSNGNSDGVPMATGRTVQEQQEAMLSFKLEPNSYTCIRCQTRFNDSSLLHSHMTQCHMGNSTTNYAVVQPNQSPGRRFTSASSPKQSPGRHFTSTSSPMQSSQGLPTATGSPLPQITSVTSLKLMHDGMNVSSASTSPMPSTSPSSSSFQSPGSMTVRNLLSSSPGTSPRGRKRSAGNGEPLNQHADMSKRTIMAAILQVNGRVAIHPIVRQNWSFLRMLTVKQFNTAAIELERLNLGKVVTLPSYRGTVFVKAEPELAQEALFVNPDLCNVQYYAGRYRQGSSKSIPEILWKALVVSGYVSDGQRLGQS